MSLSGPMVAQLDDVGQKVHVVNPFKPNRISSSL